jgi:hypothetical protein
VVQGRGEDKPLGQGLKVVYARLADDEELRDRIVCRLLDFTDEGDAIDLKEKIDDRRIRSSPSSPDSTRRSLHDLIVI